MDIFSNPNVPKTEWIAVVLQCDRQLFGMRLVVRRLIPECSPWQLVMIVDQDTIVQDGYKSGLLQFALFIKPGRYENDIK